MSQITAFNLSRQALQISVRTSFWQILATTVPPAIATTIPSITATALTAPPGGFDALGLAAAEAACAAVGLANTAGGVAGSRGWYSVV